MKIYLATWLHETNHGDSLTKIGKRERLLSYYHTIQNDNEKYFRRYVVTGMNKKEKIEGVQK